eukprot:gene7-11_t
MEDHFLNGSVAGDIKNALNKNFLLLKRKKFLLQFIIALSLRLMSKLSFNKKFLMRTCLKKFIKFFYLPLAASKQIMTNLKFKKRNKIYFIFSQIFLYNLKQFVNYKAYVFNFFGLIAENVTAELILQKSYGFFGLKVKFSGRLSSSIMARFEVIQRGLISTNNLNVYIDFAKDSVVFKYGKCGIKRIKTDIMKKLKNKSNVFFNFYPIFGLTTKGAARMGSGKGDISDWYVPVKRGKILIEFAQCKVPKEEIKKLIKNNSIKWPIMIKFTEIRKDLYEK